MIHPYTLLSYLYPYLLLLVLGCVETKCHFYSACVEQPNGQAACVCNEKCTLKFEPVCGSNGKTYINDCLMRADACKQRKSFVVLQKGACSKSFLSSCFLSGFFSLLLRLNVMLRSFKYSAFHVCVNKLVSLFWGG